MTNIKKMTDAEMTQTMYRFLIRCSSENDPTDFLAAVVRELQDLVPYDQARILFLDISGKIAGSLLYGVSQKSWKVFMDYYQDDISGSIYSLKSPLHLSSGEKINFCDWTDPERIREHEEFYSDYVRPLRLKHCMGIGFSDAENCLRAIISLDRTRDCPYSLNEKRLIRAVYPLLGNYFTALMTTPNQKFSIVAVWGTQYELTKREIEIVDLMTSGLSAGQISERLGLSVKTVYRHTANIYEKLRISSREELFALIRKSAERKNPGLQHRPQGA